MGEIKLTYNSTDYKVYCNGVSIGYKPNIVVKTNANSVVPCEVQTNNNENPIYTLKGVQLVERSGSLTSTILNTMLTTKYDGTNPIYLTIDYGASGSKTWKGIDGSTSPIKTVIRPFTVAIPMSRGDDGAGNTFEVPTFDLILQETA